MSECTHSYYRLDLKLISPMLIGSGKNRNTDNDVLVGSDGKPYIPATSIAGAFRSIAGKEAAKTLFGYVETNGQKEKPGLSETDEPTEQKYESAAESPVIISDAVTNDETYVTERDNIALDEYKVAKSNPINGGKAGAKFNYEVVQPGAVFTSIVEINKKNADIAERFEKLLAKVDKDGLSLGAKTTRGLGSVKLTVYKRSFDLEKELDEWLDFDPFKKDVFGEGDLLELPSEASTDKLRIELKLEQTGGLSIRWYTGEIGGENEAKIKNSPLLVRADVKEDEEATIDYISDPNTPSALSLPVVPGTSWAGAIRHRFSELVNDDALVKSIFGFVDNAIEKNEAEPAIKSKISFSETVLHYGKPKTLTRIAVNRFSRAVKDGAFLTEQSVFYGKGELVIRIDKGVEKKGLYALMAVIADLHNGYLAVGGETAIGRGMFKIKEMKINGKSVSPVCFDNMKEVLNACV